MHVSIDKSEAAQDVRRHIMVVGSRQWRPVREKWSAIGESSFWRLVRSVKRDIERVAAIPVYQEKGASRAASATDNDRPSGHQRSRPADNLTGDFTHLLMLEDLRRDAMALRGAAFNADGTIRDPELLDRSINLRMRVLARAVKLKSKAYENLRAGAFFEAVIDAVRQEAPHVSHRIIDRLRRLSSSMWTCLLSPMIV
jgi:hypothetical protein